MFRNISFCFRTSSSDCIFFVNVVLGFRPLISTFGNVATSSFQIIGCLFATNPIAIMADSLAWIDFSMCEAVEDGEVVAGAENASPDGAPQAKPKPKAKAKAGEKKGAGGKKNKKMCNACGKMQAVEMFSAQAIFCNVGCEAAIKRVRRVCKQQDKIAWFQQVLKNPVRLQRLLKYYAENCPRAASVFDPQLDICQYSEYEKACSYSDSFQDGIMMYKGRAMKYWQSVEGGEMTYPKAVDRWAELLQKARNGDIPEDDLGPEHSKQQLWIQTDKHVRLGNRHERGKQITQSEKAKKMKEEDIAKRKAAILMDHDDINELGGSSLGVKDSINLGSAAAGFATESGFIGGMEVMERQAEEREEEELRRVQEEAEAEEEDDAGLEEGDEEQAGDENKKKVKSWWNRDVAIAKACEDWESWSSAKLTEMKAQAEKMNKAMKSDCINHPSVRPWKATCQQVLNALNFVLSESDTSSDELKKYIASFDLPDGDDEKLEAGEGTGGKGKGKDGSSAGRMTIGNAPPCAKFASLASMKEIHHSIELIGMAEDAANLKDMQKELKAHKGVVTDLMNNFSKRLTDLNRALTAAGKVKSPAPAAGAAAAPSAQPRADAPPLTLAAFADAVAKYGKEEDVPVQIPSNSATVLAEYDLVTTHFSEEPVMLTDLNAIEKTEVAGGTMLKSVRAMKGDFMNDKKVAIEKGGSGRCSQAPRAEAAQKSIAAFFHKYMAPIAHMFKLGPSFTPDAEHPFHASMVEALQCSMFGIVKGSSHHGTEKHFFGSVRFQITGSRQVICTHFEGVYTFMKKKQVAEIDLGKSDAGQIVKGYEVDQVSKYFRHMTVELLLEYMKDSEVWIGTIPANTLFFLPPGCIYVESVTPEDDVFGLKMGYLPISKVAHDLFKGLVSKYEHSSRNTNMIKLAANACKPLLDEVLDEVLDKPDAPGQVVDSLLQTLPNNELMSISYVPAGLQESIGSSPDGADQSQQILRGTPSTPRDEDMAEAAPDVASIAASPAAPAAAPDVASIAASLAAPAAASNVSTTASSAAPAAASNDSTTASSADPAAAPKTNSKLEKPADDSGAKELVKGPEKKRGRPPAADRAGSKPAKKKR